MTDLLVTENAGPAAPAELLIATVANYNSSNGSTLYLPGTSEPTTKRYKRISGLTVASGNRVLVAKISGTYVIIGRIV